MGLASEGEIFIILIEEWMSSGASIIVTGVLMTVASESVVNCHGNFQKGGIHSCQLHSSMVVFCNWNICVLLVAIL